MQCLSKAMYHIWRGAGIAYTVMASIVHATALNQTPLLILSLSLLLLHVTVPKAICCTSNLIWATECMLWPFVAIIVSDHFNLFCGQDDSILESHMRRSPCLLQILTSVRRQKQPAPICVPRAAMCVSTPMDASGVPVTKGSMETTSESAKVLIEYASFFSWWLVHNLLIIVSRHWRMWLGYRWLWRQCYLHQHFRWLQLQLQSWLPGRWQAVHCRRWGTLNSSLTWIVASPFFFFSWSWFHAVQRR